MKPHKSTRRKVLIAGSRNMSDIMRQVTIDKVKELSSQDIVIIVGDAPGVDAICIETCVSLGIPHRVYNPEGYKPRIMSKFNYSIGDGYWGRTKAVVDMSDEGYFIWDGVSKGTIGGYARMKKNGKPTKLWTLEKGWE